MATRRSPREQSDTRDTLSQPGARPLSDFRSSKVLPPFGWRYTPSRRASTYGTSRRPFGCSIRAMRRILGRRRNQANPWFKRRRLFPAALDLLRKADKPMTFVEIGRALVASKGVTDCTSKAIRGPLGRHRDIAGEP